LTTKNPSVVISGTGQAAMPVTIISDGVVIGVATIAADGSFEVTAPLTAGDNIIIANETNDCDTIKESKPITITRQDTAEEQSVNTQAPSVLGQQSTDTVAIAPHHILNQPISNTPNSTDFIVPKITQPISGEAYAVEHILTMGIASPGSLATIYVNGLSTARVVVASDGLYGATVELRSGENTLRVSSEKDSKVATSDNVTVTRKTLASTASIASVLTATAATITTAVVTTGGLVWSVGRIRLRQK
jgi:hypothetical protein